MRLTAAEGLGYRSDGLFVREAVFSGAEIEELRDAAERVVRLAAGSLGSGDRYSIDGNRYVEANDTTVQLEHSPGSSTIRVIEPFHHFDRRFERLGGGARGGGPRGGGRGSAPGWRGDAH
ncbi:MAG: hypothetical protein VX681_03715, partial [Myxococcota bacterium]|nr:hypothetical protein [Myxococcota bacterium]